MVLVHLESPEVGIRGMVLVQETVMESVPEVVIVQGLDGVRQLEQVKQTELLRPMDLHGEYPVEVLKAILQEHPKVFQRDRVLLTAKDTVLLMVLLRDYLIPMDREPVPVTV